MTTPFSYGLIAPRLVKPTILDRLAARLFPAQQYAGLLNPEEQQAMQQRGLSQLGAGLLAASGPSTTPIGLGQAIGGALQGVDFPALAREALTMQALRQQQATQKRVSEVAQKTKEIKDPYQRITQMVTELAGEPGTEEIVGKLSNVLAQIRPRELQRPRWEFKALKEKGEWILYRINEDTGDKYRVGVAPPPSAGLAGQVAGQRQVLASMAADAIAALDAAGQTAPSLVEQLASSPLGQTVGGQYLLSESRQIQNQAGTQFTEAVLRFTTGAQAPAHELQQYLGLLTLRAGDKPGLQERKRTAQRTVLEGLQKLAVRGDVDPNEAVNLLQRVALSVRGGSEVPVQDFNVPERFRP